MMLAAGPGSLLDHDLAGFAVDPPHGIEEKDQETPHGDELKTTLGQMVVTGSRELTARADRLGARPGPDLHFDAPSAGSEPGPVINEAREVVAAV
jgi:hypothetical protein